jgi:hypothetical protein
VRTSLTMEKKRPQQRTRLYSTQASSRVTAVSGEGAMLSKSCFRLRYFVSFLAMQALPSIQFWTLDTCVDAAGL